MPLCVLRCVSSSNGRRIFRSVRWQRTDGKQLKLHPDLIVLDRSMPVMSGPDAARALRGVVPEAVLIMYCATPEECSEVALKSLGISAIVSKSENASVLIDTCRSLLYGKAA